MEKIEFVIQYQEMVGFEKQSPLQAIKNLNKQVIQLWNKLELKDEKVKIQEKLLEFKTYLLHLPNFLELQKEIFETWDENPFFIRMADEYELELEDIRLEKELDYQEIDCLLTNLETLSKFEKIVLEDLFERLWKISSEKNLLLETNKRSYNYHFPKYLQKNEVKDAKEMFQAVLATGIKSDKAGLIVHSTYKSKKDVVYGIAFINNDWFPIQKHVLKQCYETNAVTGEPIEINNIEYEQLKKD